MKSSRDGKIHILVGTNLGQIIFPPMSWSVINIPLSRSEAEKLFKNLFNTPTTHHLSLVLNRHRKKDKFRSFGAMGSFYDDANWEYLDSVSILYEKPSSSSSNGFLPLSEAGHLIYKGDAPEATKTAWFNDSVGNATNFWDLTAVEELDNKDAKTYYHKFSSQLNLILMSLSGPLESRAFGYFCDVDKNEIKNIHSFCKKMRLEVYLQAESDTEALKMINYIDNLGG